MKQLIWSLIIIAAVFVGQFIALNNSLVLRSPVFHIGIHVLGGLGIALLFSGLVKSLNLSRLSRYLVPIGGVILTGLIWEMIEAYFNITGFRLWTDAYYLDALKDVLNDLIGGVAALFIVNRRS